MNVDFMGRPRVRSFYLSSRLLPGIFVKWDLLLPFAFLNLFSNKSFDEVLMVS